MKYVEEKHPCLFKLRGISLLHFRSKNSAVKPMMYNIHVQRVTTCLIVILELVYSYDGSQEGRTILSFELIHNLYLF